MAKQIKGTLMLNNGKENGGTYKTPAIDLALKSKSGFKGGETAQRFYMKFPIYRPRGDKPPSVSDNISEVWKQQLEGSDQKPNYLIESRTRLSRNSSINASNRDRDDIRSILSDREGSIRYNKIHGRSHSITQDVKDPRAMLKMAGRQTITFPKRERFNEDTGSIIAE